MTTHLALLRGINVGGRKQVAMADLRELFDAMGHGDVRTHLRTGNVIFTPSAGTSASLAADLEKRIAADLGVKITVLLRTREELAKVLADSPFTGRGFDNGKLHVTFLADRPDHGRVAGLDALPDEQEEFRLVGREVYLHCPNGYGRTKLSNTNLEKRLGVAATTRGWKVITKLAELMG